MAPRTGRRDLGVAATEPTMAINCRLIGPQMHGLIQEGFSQMPDDDGYLKCKQHLVTIGASQVNIMKPATKASSSRTFWLKLFINQAKYSLSKRRTLFGSCNSMGFRYSWIQGLRG